jgi:hypothetical protein
MLAGAAQDTKILMWLDVPCLCRICYILLAVSFSFSLYPVLEMLQHFCRPGVFIWIPIWHVGCFLFVHMQLTYFPDYLT